MRSQILLLILLSLLIEVQSKLFTLKGDPNWPTDNQIQSFADTLSGEFRKDTDPNFDFPRSWNKRYVAKPSFVVTAKTRNDIIETIKFSTQYNLRLAIRSTGHHIDYRSAVDQGVLLDMSSFKRIQVNLQSKTATVEPGLQFGEYIREVAKVSNGKLVPLTGADPEVGVCGWGIGGGHGKLTRLYGLGADNILSIEIILANGTTITASKNSHQSLFRSLRGAGASSFGVIVSLTYQLYDETGPIYSISGYQPVSTQVGDIMQSWMESAPFYILGDYIIQFNPSANQKYVQFEFFCHSNFGSCSHLDLLIPICVSIESNNCQVSKKYDSYTELLLSLSHTPGNSLYQSSTSLSLKNPGQVASVHSLIENFSPSDHPSIFMACNLVLILGGKASDLDKDGNDTSIAPSFRNGPVLAICAAVWGGEDKRPDVIQYIDQVSVYLRSLNEDKWVQWNEPSHNFQSNQDWQSSYWFGGIQGYNKLLSVKQDYDPNNIFTCYHCVGFEQIQNLDKEICIDECPQCTNMKPDDVCLVPYIPCLNKPCLNFGKCSAIDDISQYKCECLPFFSGKNCQNDVNECILYPNGGCHPLSQCMNHQWGRTCLCLPGFQGETCQPNPATSVILPLNPLFRFLFENNTIDSSGKSVNLIMSSTSSFSFSDLFSRFDQNNKAILLKPNSYLTIPFITNQEMSLVFVVNFIKPSGEFFNIYHNTNIGGKVTTINSFKAMIQKDGRIQINSSGKRIGLTRAFILPRRTYTIVFSISSSGNITIYVNQFIFNTFKINNTPFSSSSSSRLVIGSRLLEGLLDEVAFYPTAVGSSNFLLFSRHHNCNIGPCSPSCFNSVVDQRCGRQFRFQ